MKSLEETFERAIRSAVKQKRKFSIFIGKVSEVSEHTCSVGNYKNVRLNATVYDMKSYVRVYPKDGSNAIAGRIENTDEAFLIATDEIDRIEAKIGVHHFVMNSDGYTINGDEYGGVVNAKELKAQIDKNTATLKAIQDVFSAWQAVPQDGGEALQLASNAFTTRPLADLSNIENNQFKHGHA